MTLIRLADYAEQRLPRMPSLRGADIYIFTGVRYERMDDERADIAHVPVSGNAVARTERLEA